MVKQDSGVTGPSQRYTAEAGVYTDFSSSERQLPRLNATAKIGEVVAVLSSPLAYAIHHIRPHSFSVLKYQGMWVFLIKAQL